MNKTIVAVLIALAVAIAAFFVLFGKQEVAQAPIVDPQCPEGYELVGEGCMTAKEACELGGDQYYFDEAKEQCFSR
jgi:hypothetical protein